MNLALAKREYVGVSGRKNRSQRLSCLLPHISLLREVPKGVTRLMELSTGKRATGNCSITVLITCDVTIFFVGKNTISGTVAWDHRN